MCVCVCGGGVTSYIWHSTDVRAEWPAARYMTDPLFSTKKYMNGPIFLDSYVKYPTFLTSWYIFRSEIFRGCLFS